MASNARRPPIRTRNTITREGASGATAPSATTTAATRVTRAKDNETSSATVAGKAVATTAAGSTLGTRKRTALGDLTNANKTRSSGIPTSSRGADSKDGLAKPAKGAAVASKVPRAESSAMAGKRLASRTAGASETAESKPPTTTASRISRRVVAGTSTAATSTSSRSGTSRTATATTAARRVPQGHSQEEEIEMGDAAREHKRVKVDSPPLADKEAAAKIATADVASRHEVESQDVASVAKDEGWEDLDAEDADDPLMVAEYVNEIFDYMKDLEMTTMPNGSYMDTQGEIDWNMRGVLVDWLIDIHSKFRMLPETLFLALNVVDRFLTIRAISLNKLQLVGLTAMFIAAKYEEVLCPSVGNFLFLADGGYDTEEILKAERYMLKVLGFNLSYANPMNFLRRISKADNYDIQTRTVAKYFMEISLVDFRLLEHPPSLIAAASIWMARKVLERGPWTPTLVHYSSYSEYELLGTAEIMLDYTLRPIQHSYFHKKYAAKKFMRASNYVVDWARSTYPEGVVPESEADVQDLSQLRVDLFAQEGLVRPMSTNSSVSGDSASRQGSPDA